MKEEMNFSVAFDYLLSGGSIALGSWSPDVYITIQNSDENSKMTADYLYVTSRFGKVPWMPTQIEILSNDWRRINP